MAKPRHNHNKTNQSKGAEDGMNEAKEKEEGKGNGGEGGEWKERASQDIPPPLIATNRHREGLPARDGR